MDSEYLAEYDEEAIDEEPTYCSGVHPDLLK